MEEGKGLALKNVRNVIMRYWAETIVEFYGI